MPTQARRTSLRCISPTLRNALGGFVAREPGVRDTLQGLALTKPIHF